MLLRQKIAEMRTYQAVPLAVQEDPRVHREEDRLREQEEITIGSIPRDILLRDSRAAVPPIQETVKEDLPVRKSSLSPLL